jgi:hypothetical protein
MSFVRRSRPCRQRDPPPPTTPYRVFCTASSRPGNVFLREGKRGAVWYAKYRLPDGRQLKRRIGPAYTGRGRPPAGVFTRRMAEEWLSGVLAQARGGTLPGMVQTGVTFEQACEAYLEWLLYERQRRPSTLRDCRSIMRTTCCRCSPTWRSRTSPSPTASTGARSRAPAAR